MRRILSWFLPTSVLLFAMAAPAAGQITLPLPTITGSSLSIPLSVAGLVANLNLTFETVTHLNLANLGVSVRLVTPLDRAFLARLPPTVSLPVGLPIVVKVEPATTGGLTFTGLVTLQMVSLSLPSTSNLALYGAPIGGSFTDLTDVEGDTTYRVAGSRGGFSEFVVVVDHTPLAQTVSGKLDALSAVLTANSAAIAPTVRTELTAEIAAIRAHVTASQLSAAIVEVDAFLATAERHSGAEIPDVWSAAHDRIDVAGQLRAAGRTLRYSLNLERAGNP